MIRRLLKRLLFPPMVVIAALLMFIEDVPCIFKGVWVDSRSHSPERSVRPCGKVAPSIQQQSP